MTMIQHKKFDTGRPGPRVLFFGAIHGNERCGPGAIETVIKELESGKLSLSSGSACFVPICNTEAYERNTRFIEEDLNRVFRKHETPRTHEQRLAHELTSYIDESDIFLDIHSMQAAGPVNLFIDFPTEENRSFARVFNAPYAILGWPKLYAETGVSLLSGDTTEYAHKKGKVGLLIECGQHEDPEATAVAYRAIYATLAYAKLIAAREAERPIQPMKEITMTELFVKHAEGDRFSRIYTHLDPIAAGEVIAIRETGEEIRAAQDSIMILPKLKGPVGKEWFYLGVIPTNHECS